MFSWGLTFKLIIRYIAGRKSLNVLPCFSLILLFMPIICKISHDIAAIGAERPSKELQIAENVRNLLKIASYELLKNDWLCN